MEATLIDGKPISCSGDISTIVDIQRLLWEACIGRLEVRLALFHGSDHALPLLGGTSDNGLGTPLYISFPLLFIYPIRPTAAALSQELAQVPVQQDLTG
jgi:hypothetical protein